MRNNTLTPHHGYNVGHPWYYYLGGAIPMPKQIFCHVEQGSYGGYMAGEIVKTDKRPEPQRTEHLRALRQKFKSDLFEDLNRYRELVRELRIYRDQALPRDEQAVCDNIHTNMSLKTSHLINDFAHIISLNRLLDQQRDLFEV